jgi:DNA-binding GntR family transcriptional regulator
VPLSREHRQDQPEALLSYIEKRIKQAVVSGELKPGAKLSPSVIAADLGVSHIPVREALTSLAASGYLEHRLRVGFFVRILSPDDLADIYHWREILEREAFIMAIPRLIDDDIEEMRRLCSQMRRLIGPGGWREFLDLNRQFHFIAFRRAGSDQLLRFLSYLWDSAESYSVSGLGNIEKAQQHHEQMMDLFEARDVNGIIETMTQHRGLGAGPGPARS